jgi:hypothetical protein
MEVLNINLLMQRSEKLNQWIKDIDFSVPDQVIDVKFWREELTQIRQELDDLVGRCIIFSWADRQVKGQFEKTDKFRSGLGIRFGEFKTSFVNPEIIKEWRYDNETNS